MVKTSYWNSIYCYEGKYHNEKTGESFRTMLCDWKCSRCENTLKGLPEGDGEPEECACSQLNNSELKKFKKGKLKLAVNN